VPSRRRDCRDNNEKIGSRCVETSIRQFRHPGPVTITRSCLNALPPGERPFCPEMSIAPAAVHNPGSDCAQPLTRREAGCGTESNRSTACPSRSILQSSQNTCEDSGLVTVTGKNLPVVCPCLRTRPIEDLLTNSACVFCRNVIDSLTIEGFTRIPRD